MSPLLLIFVFCGLAAAQAGTRPNIVYILADDLGWSNVGFHNSEMITPTLDSFKKNGIELTRHYAYKFCSPTRSSLMTGRLPIHVNERNNPNSVPNGGVPRKMTMISAKLKSAGYATHHVGKWHMGMAYPDKTPEGRGFDSALGFFEGAEDHYTQKIRNPPCLEEFVDLWNTDEPATGLNGTYGGYLYTEAAVKTIVTHDTRVPLFLYAAFQNAHSPLQIPQEYVDRYSNQPINEHRRLYQGMVTFLDEAIGNITKALIAKGMWENTLIVFSADNGGPTYWGPINSVIDGGANNFPLKGGKTSDWEGGVRTVALATGGLIPKKLYGTEQSGYIHICDWYATFCYLAGVDPKDHEAEKAGLMPIDSLNMWPLLTGATTTSPRNEIPLSSYSGMTGEQDGYVNLISGQYKLLVGEEQYAGWTGPQYPNATNVYLTARITQDCTSGCLYNIIKDPNEYEELSQSMPLVHAQLMTRSKEIGLTVFNVTYDDPSERACLFARLYGGFWGPYMS